ncbi:MAG: ribonuclease Z [Chitinophagales bacterium]|jgi:ribonuclease Z|nr:ribonuclease Z [Chitinophagales bacterium]
MTFEVTILGSNSALPSHGRHPTSQVVNHNENLYLLDCGEGTQIQLSTYKIKRSKINHIFISHLHGDHYYGLIGLLTSYHLLKRTEPVNLYGPKGLKEILEVNFRYSDTRLVYTLNIHEINCSDSELILESDQLAISTIPMKHRIPCCGFLFRQKPAGRKIIAEKIAFYEIPLSAIPDLRTGKDISLGDRKIPNEELTTDPPIPKSYAYCSDTLYNETFLNIIHGVDMMYHETTFMDDSKGRAEITYHSTTLQAGMIAKKAAVKKLLIGHFSSKYDDLSLLLQETKSIFENTELAEEGKIFKI